MTGLSNRHSFTKAEEVLLGFAWIALCSYVTYYWWTGSEQGPAGAFLRLLSICVCLVGIAGGYNSVTKNILWLWKRYSKPATIGTYEGKPVLERVWDKFYVELFHADGNRFGVMQHHFDFGEYPETHQGEPELKFSRTLDCEKYRLSWLARLRSPKLPVGNSADVIGNDDTIVGQTTYTVN